MKSQVKEDTKFVLHDIDQEEAGKEEALLAHSEREKEKGVLQLILPNLLQHEGGVVVTAGMAGAHGGENRVVKEFKHL